MTTPRPTKESFSAPELAFLQTKLLDYNAMIESLGGTGTRGLRGVKGQKKGWVLNHIYPGFLSQFHPDEIDGPSLQSVQTVSGYVSFPICLLMSSTRN